MKPDQYLFILLLACGVIISFVAPAHTQIRGDSDLLLLVGSQWRANFDCIRTWQGEVEIVDGHSIGNSGSSANRSTSPIKILFAVDGASRKSQFLAFQNQKKGQRIWGGISTPEIEYVVPPWNKDGNSGELHNPSLLLKNPSAERTGDFSEKFDPLSQLSGYKSNNSNWLGKEGSGFCCFSSLNA